MFCTLFCLLSVLPEERFHTEKPSAECQFEIDKLFGPTAELLMQQEVQKNIRQAIGSEMLEVGNTDIKPVVKDNKVVGVRVATKTRNRIQKCGETPVDCANEIAVYTEEASLTTYLVDGKDGDLTYFAVVIKLKQVEQKTLASISMWVELKDKTVDVRLVRFGSYVSALKLKRAILRATQPEVVNDE